MPINIIENDMNIYNQENNSLSDCVENVKIEFSDVNIT